MKQHLKSMADHATVMFVVLFLACYGVKVFTMDCNSNSYPMVLTIIIMDVVEIGLLV